MGSVCYIIYTDLSILQYSLDKLLYTATLSYLQLCIIYIVCSHIIFFLIVETQRLTHTCPSYPEMLRLLCRAAPVEWRNEQNYTLRRRGARENRMTSLNDRYFTNLTIEHDVFLEGLTNKTADVWVIGSEVGL